MCNPSWSPSARLEPRDPQDEELQPDYVTPNSDDVVQNTSGVHRGLDYGDRHTDIHPPSNVRQRVKIRIRRCFIVKYVRTRNKF